jgi:hypothetical protein
MTTLDFATTSSFLVGDRVSSSDRFSHDDRFSSSDRLSSSDRFRRFGIALVQLHDQLWRVTRRSGEVLGYIESFDESGSPRFRAKRMFSSRRTSLPLGEFWSIDDAIDCFRFN